MGDFLAGLLGLAGDFGTQAINNDFQREMLNKQLDYNTQIYNQQYADTLAMYERQLADSRQNTAEERAWNSETAQAARLKAAGINPALQGVGSSSSGSASTPSMSAPQKQLINFADFAPKFALGMESFTQMLSAIEDLRSKRIANRNAETESIDESLMSVFDIDDLEKISKFVGSSDSGLLKDIKGRLSDSISSGHGGTLDAAIVTADSPLRKAANKIYLAMRDQGFNKRNAKRLTTRALRRLNTAEFKSRYMGFEADRAESAFKSTTAKSQYGYDDTGKVSDILADVFSAVSRAQLDSVTKRGDEDAVRGELYKQIRRLQNYEGKGKVWAQIASVLISAYIEVGR